MAIVLSSPISSCGCSLLIIFVLISLFFLFKSRQSTSGLELETEEWGRLSLDHLHFYLSSFPPHPWRSPRPFNCKYRGCCLLPPSLSPRLMWGLVERARGDALAGEGYVQVSLAYPFLLLIRSVLLVTVPCDWLCLAPCPIV